MEEWIKKRCSTSRCDYASVLRYYRAFHVMVVDEIDAFPYCADQMLQYAVKQAMKEKAARIYLTATPDETWKRNLNKVNKRCYCFWTISSSSFASSFILLVRELEKTSFIKEFLEFYYSGYKHT